MGLIAVDDLQPGMVLAQDIRSPQGRLLFSQGTELDEVAIQTIKFWGLFEAPIRGVAQNELDVNRLAAMDPALIEAARQETERRLVLSDPRHPALAALKRVVFFDIANSGVMPAPPPSPELPKPAPPGKRVDPARLAASVTRLASLPKLVQKVLEALNDPNVSYAYVAGLIGKDVGLAAKLLTIVNSPLYAFPEPIESIGRAVSVVGVDKLVSLALGVSLVSHFGPAPQNILDMRSFWEHSLGTAVLARLLGAAIGHPNEERCFLAGLLHDVGRLVMLTNHPGLSVQAMAHAWRNNEPLSNCERETWGFDHAQLGGMLLTSWRFPQLLTQAVERHHNPDGPNFHQDAALTHVADVMAHALAIGQSGSPATPPLDLEAWEGLGIPLGALGCVAAQAKHQLADISHTLLSGHDPKRN